jgi:hypothetical protein
LEVAKNTRLSLIKRLQGKRTIKEKKEFENDPLFQEIMEAIADNINTPKLLAVVQGAVNA